MNGRLLPAPFHKPYQAPVFTPAGDDVIDPLLRQLLEIRTPYGHEDDLAHLLPPGYHKIKGNYVYRVGRRDERTTMFSSHLDTVHRQPGRIRIVEKEGKAQDYGYVYALDEDGKPSVLGADDKAGVWIMLKLLEKRIPGLYVFHVGEEKGGIGSSQLAAEAEKMLKNLKHCVAFDRKGITSVITKQAGGRCCSEEFANALAGALNTQMLTGKTRFILDDGGTFTDSANYAHLIPECTNLSVGYYHAHTSSECLDVYWLQAFLLPALLNVKWSELPAVRTPETLRKKYTSNNGYGKWYGNNTNQKHEFKNITKWTDWDRYPDLDLKKLPDITVDQYELVLRRELYETGIKETLRNCAIVFSQFVKNDIELSALKDNLKKASKLTQPEGTDGVEGAEEFSIMLEMLTDLITDVLKLDTTNPNILAADVMVLQKLCAEFMETSMPT